jgi:hypothetical protein
MYVVVDDDTDNITQVKQDFFIIDTTPFISFVSPTPLDNSIFQYHTSVNVSLTVDYFANEH